MNRPGIVGGPYSSVAGPTMNKTTNKFSPEVLTRPVRMVLDQESDYPSRWATVVSVAEKIGCVPQTLHEWVKKAEVDSGQRAGVRSDTAGKIKAGGYIPFMRTGSTDGMLKFKPFG